MSEYKIVTLRERKDLANKAANWFHIKWGVPVEAYKECINCKSTSMLNIRSAFFK